MQTRPSMNALMPYAALGACLGHNHLTPGGPHRNPLLLPPAEGQNQEHRPPSRSSRAAERSLIAPAAQPEERPGGYALRRTSAQTSPAWWSPSTRPPTGWWARGQKRGQGGLAWEH